MIVQKRTVSATSSPSKPPKRRRRTATQVLAGYFDPRPHRDILTNMYNNSSPDPSSTISAAPSRLYFDIRTPEHFSEELPLERAHHVFTVKRRRTLQENHRQTGGKVEEWTWARSNRAQEVREARIPVPPQVVYSPRPGIASNIDHVRDPSGYRLQDSFYSSSEMSRRTAESPNPVLPVLASSGSEESVYYQAPRNTDGHLPYIQTSEVAPSTNWPVPGPPSSIPSPPTPTRSVSSITSGTSSRRLRTPDEGEAPMILTRRHHEDSELYSKQSDSRVPATEHAYVDIDAKIPYRASSMDRASSNGDAQTPTIDHYSHGYPSPAWPSAIPTQQQQSSGDSVSGYGRSAAGPSLTTVPDRTLCGPPSPSYAHRRNALSLAGLLSPISAPYTSPNSYPFPLPTNNNSGTSPKLSFSSILHPNNTPVLSSVPAAPQGQHSSPPLSSVLPTPSSPRRPPLGSPISCLEPEITSTALLSPSEDVEMVDASLQMPEIRQTVDLASSGEAAVSETADKISSTDQAMASTEPPASLTAVAMSPTVVESPIDYATPMDSVEMQVKVKQPRKTPSGITRVYLRLPPREMDHEASGVSDMEAEVRPSRGKRSKTSRVIESDDEEDDEYRNDGGGSVGDWVSSSSSFPFLGQQSSSRPKLTLKRNVGTKRMRTDSLASVTMPDEVANSPVSVSAVSVMAPVRVKKPTVKKGWKGWVEVDVDEVPSPSKAFNPQALPPGERRTRSGKQFDG